MTLSYCDLFCDDHASVPGEVGRELHTPWSCKLFLLRLVADHLWFQTLQEMISHWSWCFAESSQWTSLQPCSWKQDSVMMAIKDNTMFIVLRYLTDVSKPIKLSSRVTILKYDFHRFESAKNPICFPFRLNLHIGILKKKL